MKTQKPTAGDTHPVCCNVCRKTTASNVVKDFASHTYYACKGCIRKMVASHPSSPTIVR